MDIFRAGFLQELFLSVLFDFKPFSKRSFRYIAKTFFQASDIPDYFRTRDEASENACKERVGPQAVCPVILVIGFPNVKASLEVGHLAETAPAVRIVGR